MYENQKNQMRMRPLGDLELKAVLWSCNGTSVVSTFVLKFQFGIYTRLTSVTCLGAMCAHIIKFASVYLVYANPSTTLLALEHKYTIYTVN